MNKQKKFLAILLLCTLLALGSLLMTFNSYTSYKRNLDNMEYNLSQSDAALIDGDREEAQTQTDWAMEAGLIVDQRKTEMAVFSLLSLAFLGTAVWSGLRYKKV